MSDKAFKSEGTAELEPRTGKVLACSAAVARMLGSSPETAVGRPLAELLGTIGETQAEQLRRLLDAETDREEISGIETAGHAIEILLERLACVDGERVTAVFHDSGEAIGTGRRLELALDRARTGSWEWNVQTGETRFNDMWYQMLGYEPGEMPMTVDTWKNLCHPDDLDRALAGLEANLKGHTNHYECMHRLKTKSGRWLWIRDVGSVTDYTDDGEPLWMVGLHIDIDLSKRTEIELHKEQENKSRLAAVAERTDNAVVITDAHGEIEWVNAGFTRVTGYEPEEVIGSRPGNMLQGPDTDPEAVARMHAAVRLREGFSEEIINYSKDGRPYWVQVECEPLFDFKGDHTGFMAIESDVTERKELMMQIQESAERLRFATEAANTGVWEFNIERGELVWDPTMYEIYDVDPNTRASGIELWADCVHPDDLLRAQGDLEEAIESRSKLETTFRIVRTDGTVRTLAAMASVQLDEHGNAHRVVGVNTDITAQIENETEIRRVNENLNHVGALASIGGWEVDLVNDKIHWSKEVRRIHEVSDDYQPTLEEAIAFYPGESRKLISDAVEHAIATGESWDLKTQFVTAKGNELWVRALGEAVFEDGRCIRLVGAFQDITEQQLASIALEEARTAAEAASEAKTSFLANMSHEIRTPMTAILGYTDLLGDPTLSRVTLNEHVSTIKRNGEHLLSIINDILDLSKIEAGKMQVEQIALDPVELAREVHDLLRVRTEGKSIDLDLSFSRLMPATIESDPVRLRQVLMNVVGNAIKFTEVGSVKVKCSFVDGDAPSIRFAVKDSGIGMSEEQMGSLFKSFMQADESMTRRFGGTGLGLKISKRLAEALGGDITVESELGSGSTFTIEIATGACGEMRDSNAARTPAAKPEPASAANSLTPLAGIRALLVEDGPDNQRLISFHLRKAGAKVDLASDGQEGLDTFLDTQESGTPYDIVLMDMQMPVLDGYGATQQLRSRGVRTPIIALTAHAMSGDRNRCLDAGCDDYATKPIDKAKLVELCTRWTAGGGASKAA